MKISKPINVAGFYRQNDGLWQSAMLLTDGLDVMDIIASTVSDKPAFPTADLAGIETACNQDIDLLPEDIATICSCSVVSDLRSSDIAMGGQGAPLHPFYLHALAWMNEDCRSVGYLFAGANTSLVWADPKVDDPSDLAALVCFETGPGFGTLKNIPDTQKSGHVVDGALELFLDDPFFRRLVPKWVEPTNFGPLLELVSELSPEDAWTTLLGMSATSVLLAQEHIPSPPSKFVVLGEGAKSQLFTDLLTAALDIPVELPDPEVWDLSTVNAQAVAYLAARVVRGLPTTAPHTTGVAAAVGGGTITESA